MTESRVTEDRFLGALLGMAIGDAIGSATISPSRPVDENDESYKYQVSAISEVCLAIVESLTTNDGLVDVDNIVARIGFIAASASQERMSRETLDGLAWTLEHERLHEAGGDADLALDVASRGIPFGLLHAIGPFDTESLSGDTVQATRITHSGVAVESGTLSVAALVTGAARREPDLALWLSRSGFDHGPVVEMATAIERAESYEEVVTGMASGEAPSDAYGAIIGAAAGAWFGVADIPQGYIDALDARIYLTLAAPWFNRTALRRQGTVIDLRRA